MTFNAENTTKSIENYVHQMNKNWFVSSSFGKTPSFNGRFGVESTNNYLLSDIFLYFYHLPA